MSLGFLTPGDRDKLLTHLTKCLNPLQTAAGSGVKAITKGTKAGKVIEVAGKANMVLKVANCYATSAQPAE
ncbi:hypothetical protein [Streptomyces decoyicus]|uniref:hypothetical protein n=1 Tax=Streptomyces decoyicus TaxID=249567 RepID=UPI003660E0AC